MKGDRVYAQHILDCIDRITRYCEHGEDSFRGSELIQDAVLRNLQILAESTQRISAKTKSRYTTVDWRAMAGFRNVLVHDYLGINLVRVWEIVSVQLPVLRFQVERIRIETD